MRGYISKDQLSSFLNGIIYHFLIDQLDILYKYICLKIISYIYLNFIKLIAWKTKKICTNEYYFAYSSSFILFINFKLNYN